MNNNKKYKKWSLGLVAPALVLAPIAVVASCSSSGEEKAVYSVSFKDANLSVKASTNVKPSKLSKEGFVQEIINNKANIFNIDDSSGKVTDDFLRANLVVGDITADDSAKTASAKVTLNNKNTDGGSDEATITLTELEEADITGLKYTIDFVDKTTGEQTIQLNDKSEVSVTSLDKSALLKLVLEDEIKKQILTISGNDAEKITNQILENQILEITESSITPDKAAGTIKFELKVLNDGTKIKASKTKTIIFTGFKKEADTDKGVETTANASVSTITLGLNGNVGEVKQQASQLNEKWVFDNKHAFFKQGDELITDETAISEVKLAEVTSKPTEMTLTFKVAEGKWYGQDGTINKTDKKDLSIKIEGLSSAETSQKTLSEKFNKTTPLAITKIEPRLSGITKADAKTLLEGKKFIFEYMKHFLTGDFKFVIQSDTADTFFKGDITVTEEADDVLAVAFNIAEGKTVQNGTDTANNATVAISFKLNGFATTK